MSEPARLQFPGLTFSGPHIVQTLAGISADIHHISGNVNFDGFVSSPRFVECVLKVLRVSPADHNQIVRMENVLSAFSQHISARNAAYNHPNIAPVNVVNVTRTAENQPIVFNAILSPWYSGGNILEHVDVHSGVDRMALLTEIGKALKHLHSHDVVHAAIYPSNILIGNDGHAVVTDAGVRTLMSQCIFIPSGRLPIPPSAVYQPSEQLCPATNTVAQPTTFMDVYSFAVTAWTIFAGKIPFSDHPNCRTIAQIVVEISLHGHQHLAKPQYMSIALWALLQRCLDMDPAVRPTMVEVVAELESLSL